ncbi:hypothetical protein K8Z49_24045 [Actinomadura madurae]|uniref:hypothetical protein n=1 Tax=Actinomadura madurae TaxID=1993 RepID=UPI000D8D9DAD|nr:hypothetical protein [Actinomadura madurae]SPT51445.1 Uncharacterised protein [Actinomadura madurae]
MSSGQQTVGSIGEARASRKARGSASLVLGALAVAMIACPWSPSFASPWIRFLPVYLFVPTVISALVSGGVALQRMRGDEDADRRRARAGITLGLVAIALALATVAWAIWTLSQVETY